MALSDYNVTLSCNEMNSGDNGREIFSYDNNREIVFYDSGREMITCDNDRENIIYDEQTNSDENYMPAPSSPEVEKLDRLNNQSASQLRRHDSRSSPCDDSENSCAVILPSSVRQTRKSQGKKQIKPTRRKNPRNRARVGHKNTVRNKIVPKPKKSSCKIKTSKTHSSKSKVYDKGISLQCPAVDTKLLVPASALSKLKKNQSTTKAKPPPVTPATSLTHEAKPTATSILLSMMAEAVSTPKYTSVHTFKSSTISEYSEYPARSSWPLLRDMIASPPVTVVSISPAPRQTLSTVKVESANAEEPKANVISKLEKEIKCECKFNKGQPCWLLFQEDRLRKERLHHLTLKRESLDLVILAKIAANINREEKTKKFRGRDRQRCRVCYYHEGRQICRETFMFIHGICKGRLCALMQHYKKKGLSVRVHGNKSNVPHHALSYSDNERVLDFIQEYANNHCISSFCRKPGSKAGGGLLIMSPDQSKLYVHHKFKMWCSKNNYRAVSLRSFQNLWTKHLPYIVVLRGSNKTPVPEIGSQKTALKLPEDVKLEDEMVPAEMTPEKSLSLLVSGSNKNTNDALRDANTFQDTFIRHVHCGTNTQSDFYSVTDGKKKRKRKGLPPRKVEPSSSLPLISADRDFGHNQNFDDSQLVHASVGCTQNNLNSTRNVSDNNNGDNIIQNPPPQSDMHHSMFNSDLHIPQTTSSFSLQDHATVAMNFHSRLATSPVMTANRDTIYSYNNKTAISLTKTTNLHPALYLPQPSQFLDSYSIQCYDKFVPPISGSHGLGDQSQPVLLSPQGPDFSNMHQIDWQTWQPYSSL